MNQLNRRLSASGSKKLSAGFGTSEKARSKAYQQRRFSSEL